VLLWIAAMPALAESRPAEDASGRPIEELVVQDELGRYSALKSDTPIMETARSVSIESLKDIFDKGALKLADTYTYSAGVTGLWAASSRSR
jgi:iron complex outermembrane receptor protein